MDSHIMTVIARKLSEPERDERGEVNASMIAWMVVSALVIFAFRAQLTGMLDGNTLTLSASYTCDGWSYVDTYAGTRD